MIARLKDTQNGYALLKSSSDEDLQSILKQYLDKDNFKCIICNNRTAKCFKPSIVPITINNKLLSGVFYINNIF